MEGPQSAEMLVMFWIPGMSHRLLLCTRNRREQTVNESTNVNYCKDTFIYSHIGRNYLK